MVEIEIGIMVRQCLSRRIADKAILVAEIAKWERRRNRERARIEWMFTVDRARQKLGRAYPPHAGERPSRSQREAVRITVAEYSPYFRGRAGLRRVDVLDAFGVRAEAGLVDGAGGRVADDLPRCSRSLAAAVDHDQRHGAARPRFLDDPDVWIDNSATKREFQTVAKLRLNMLFAGSTEGAHRAGYSASILNFRPVRVSLSARGRTPCARPRDTGGQAMV
jgi:hypothetical protein